MKLLIQKGKECWFCKTTYNLHKHHIYYGTANRKISEKIGAYVYLCSRHHNMSDNSVHFNREMDLILKKKYQKEFEKQKTREEFVKIIGKSYL